MSEDFDIDDAIAALDREDEEVEDEHAEVIEEAEKKADKEEGRPPKKSRVEERVDALERKYEQDALKSAISRFKDQADAVELEIFDAARKDEPLKNLSDFEAAAEIARRRAASLRETEEKMAKEAEERVAKAWGVGPVGRPQAPADHDKELMERIGKGDTRALVESIIGDDLPF
ncbi:MAG: hypothetical protein PHU54_06185 [Candidatus Omnitrophica bacterium]|jgi:hypothetical protein|nr:hypothetical protein [Candidatus Omnitrophota bacterium]